MNSKLASLTAITIVSLLPATDFGQGQTQGAPVGKGRQRNTRQQKPPAPPKPVWEQFPLNPKTKIFLDFTDANADMIISIFSRTSGITILKDPTFKIPLTVTSAKSVGLKEAFEIFNTVLGMNGYELQKQGNLMLVGRKMPPPMIMMPQPPPPVPVIKTYPIKNANATQIARVVNEVFGTPAGGAAPNPGFPVGITFGPNGPQPSPAPGGGGKPNGVHATSEDYSNSVVVSGLPSDQTNVEALIKDLDKTTTQPLESELFHLKYVPADQAVTAIEDVLTANQPTGRGMAKKNESQNSGFFFGGFDPFGGGSQRHSAGGQSATAVVQTNSVIVNATKENIELIRKLISQMDQPGAFVGTTFVIKLENAKAQDVADLLTKVFSQKASQDNNPFVFFSSDFSNPNKKNPLNTDLDENGQIVNIRDLAGKVSVNADPNTNSLVIVTQPSNMKMIRNVIDQLDHVAEQVMIETIIVEANLDKTTKLGVEWSFLQNKIFGNSNGSTSGSTNFGLGSASPALEGLNYTISGGAYKSFLNALQTDSRFKVLDTPRIFTSNNVKAAINVSQKLPYITSQDAGALGNIISQYQFQDIGVVLTVTPRITASGQVTMDVVQTADDLQGFTTFNAPIINHREASTTVSVGDGQTIVLGGIIRHTVTTTENKIPFLGDLPIIGNLFKSSSKEAGQTELMVFLTPHIVHSAADAQRIREEETKRLSKESQDGLKKLKPPPPDGKGG